MNGLGKPLRKQSNPKNQKTVKVKVKVPHVNTTKTIFQTPQTQL